MTPSLSEKVKKIDSCRMCGNENLEKVVDLGQQFLTGVFPKEKSHDNVTKGPLILVKCHGDNSCGLLQLEHTYDLEEMYGDNYGYRSGLNAQMVSHLKQKITDIQNYTEINEGDLVIDIGANDGTSLSFYPENLDLVGVDPTAERFKHYYKEHINIIPDFFSFENLSKYAPNKRAKVITSFSMLYDLEAPLTFAREISQVLDPKDGIWCFEQSYMPLMIDQMAFDTICHEHLEYYGLHQIKWLLDNSDMKILDVEFNDVNGGSFSVIAANKLSSRPVNEAKIQKILAQESERKLNELGPYLNFEKSIDKLCDELIDFVRASKADNKKVAALGASTKGNVLLQRCNFTSDDIVAVGEVNEDKFGSFTPGTSLPIVPEKEVLDDNIEYLLVLPWHFKKFFISNPSFKNKKLVFPMPKFEIVQP